MEFYVTRSSGTKKKNDEKNELKHYGIKGQQWGKRNYQYEDGSLTPEGKRRYADNKSSRANMLTSQTQTWTAKRADQIDSNTLDKLKEKLAEDRSIKRPSDIAAEKLHNGATGYSSVDKERLSRLRKMLGDTLVEVTDTDRITYEYKDQNGKKKLMTSTVEGFLTDAALNLQENITADDLGVKILEIETSDGIAYSKLLPGKLTKVKEIEPRKATQEEIAKMRKAMNRQVKKPVSTTDR